MLHTYFKVKSNKNNTSLSQQRISSGFTFVEIIFSLFIMAIFFTIGVANYRGFASRQQVDAVQRLLTGDLRLAQQKSVSGIVPTGCATPFGGYSVARQGQTTYVVRFRCNGTDTLLKTVDLSDSYNGITITTNFDILFSPLANGVTFGVGSGIINITDGTNPRTITVSTIGEIN